MTDAMKAVGQDVQQETADELVRVEGHDAVTGLAGLTVIFPFESNTLAVEGDEAGIGNGDAMGVAGEIGEHLVGAGEGRFGVDHPVHTAEWPEEFPEYASIVKRGILAEELQRAFGVGGDKTLTHESAEESREYLNAEEVTGPATYPVLPVRRDATARYDAMNVGMMSER